jgi:arsenite-transporting ATPase
MSAVTTPFFIRARNLRLLLFGGKGGVGKTTCAIATALRLARCFFEDSFLIVSTDPAHSLTDGIAGFLPPPNLRILELDAQQSLEAFKAKHAHRLQAIAARGTFLDDQDIRQFLGLSLPGLDELMGFLEIAKWVRERHCRCIVVDTAPSGHTMRLLAVPEILRKWLDALDAMLAKHRYMARLFRGRYRSDDLDNFLVEMADSVKQTRELLEDPESSCFVPVMIPEPLVVAETALFVGELERQKVPIGGIVVNRLYPASQCPVCECERNSQRNELRRLPEELSRYPLWGIPLYPEEVRGQKPLESFWGKVFRLNEPGAPEVTPIVSDSGGITATGEPARVIEGPPVVPHPETSLLVFAGKGGVGKTTLACATAVRLARDLPDKEVFLFSTDPAHSLSACLDVPVGPEPVRICPGLTAMEIDATAEFELLKAQYADDLERFLASVLPNLDLTFDHQVMARVMDLAPPGLDEIMALTRAMGFLTQDRYDMLILDSAPTGHLVRLLELPQLIEQWLKVLFGLFLKYRDIFRLTIISRRLVEMSKNLKTLTALLHDPTRSALYGVSILTGMALEETKDLVAACVQMGVHVPVLFLNLATPPSDCRLCSALHRRESSVRREFRKAFLEQHQTLVYRHRGTRGLDDLAELGRLLYQDRQTSEKVEKDHAAALA